MTTSTHSLEEYAAALLGPGPDGTSATVEAYKLEWLAIRLRRGDLPGFKAGRRWRATDDDIAQAIEALRPKQIPSIPSMSGLTRTSRRRLRAS